MFKETLLSPLLHRANRGWKQLRPGQESAQRAEDVLSLVMPFLAPGWPQELVGAIFTTNLSLVALGRLLRNPRRITRLRTQTASRCRRPSVSLGDLGTLDKQVKKTGYLSGINKVG